MGCVVVLLSAGAAGTTKQCSTQHSESGRLCIAGLALAVAGMASPSSEDHQVDCRWHNCGAIQTHHACCVLLACHACCACVLQVRCGNYPVVERNHTVLLNWNHQTLPVLKQVRSLLFVFCW